MSIQYPKAMTRQKSLSEALDSIFRVAHTPKGIAEPVRKFLRSILKFQLSGVGQGPLTEVTLTPPSIIRARTLHTSGWADLPAAPLPCVVHAAQLDAQCRDALETRRRPADLCLLTHLSKQKVNSGRCVASRR